MVIARTVDSARLRVGCLRLILINRGTLLPCACTFHILERTTVDEGHGRTIFNFPPVFHLLVWVE